MLGQILTFFILVWSSPLGNSNSFGQFVSSENGELINQSGELINQSGELINQSREIISEKGDLLYLQEKMYSNSDHMQLSESSFGEYKELLQDIDLQEEYMERRKRSSFYRKGSYLAEKASSTLDQVQHGYDKRVRPFFGVKPVEVSVNMYIRSMGPIDEVKQIFTFDCYFRQSWYDERLAFNSTDLHTLALDWKFLNKIWKPDTFFVNGMKSYLHKITVPNRFCRVFPDGKVSYSQRLTIWASCKMSLRKFPLDAQACYVEIGSYGYIAQDVVYRWDDPPFGMDPLELAQYIHVDTSIGVNHGNHTKRIIETGLRTDSTVYIKFNFERMTGFFLLWYYTPMTVIILCSWLSPWIVKTDVPARACLGILTILSITKIGFGGKGKPQVGYPTALDIFTLICFFCVFGTMLEFAVINFIDTYIKRYKLWEEDQQKLKELMEIKDELVKEEEKHKQFKENEVLNENEDTKDLSKHSNVEFCDEYDKKCVVTLTPNDISHVEQINEKIKLSQDATNLTIKDNNDEYNKRFVVKLTANNVSHIATIAHIDELKLDIDLVDTNNDTETVEVSENSDNAEDFTTEESETKDVTESSSATADLNIVNGVERLMMLLRKMKIIVMVAVTSLKPRPVPEMLIYEDTKYVVDRIDEYARVACPAVFLTLNIFYWIYYLYMVEDVDFTVHLTPPFYVELSKKLDS